MISETMEKELNAQINKEIYSSYLYFAMAAYLKSENLDGAAHFMQEQAKEEIGHAMKMYGYVNEQGGRVILEAIEKPNADYADVEEVFTLALKHEQYITKSINNLVDLAISEKDHATKAFLDWYVSEQVEEEASMDSIVRKIGMAGKTGQALLMLDGHLARRGQ